MEFGTAITAIGVLAVIVVVVALRVLRRQHTPHPDDPEMILKKRDAGPDDETDQPRKAPDPAPGRGQDR